MLPLAIEQAALDGWELTESMLDEGQVAVNLGAPTINDRVRWTFMLPCADTWFVWVRYYHFASGASYYAWLDETPEPPELAVFDGDCEDGITPFYAWEALRWRYEAADACETVAEPWVGEWDEGEHSVTLAKRDSPAIARALITNDPGFTPGPSD